MSEKISTDTAVLSEEPKPKAKKKATTAATKTAKKKTAKPAAEKAAAEKATAEKPAAAAKPRVTRSKTKKEAAPAAEASEASSNGAAPESAPSQEASATAAAVQIEMSLPSAAPVAPPPSEPAPVSSAVHEVSVPDAKPSAAPEMQAASPVAAPTATSAPAQPIAPAPAQAEPSQGGQQPQHGQQPQNGQQQQPRSPDGLNSRERRRRRWKEKLRERREQWRQQQAERQGQGGGGGGGTQTQPEDTSAPEAQGGEGQAGERQPERPLGPPEAVEGILELSPKGYGFLRQKDRGYNQTPNDAFVSPEFIRKFGLREGMEIKGESRKGHRGPQVTEISEVNNRAPEAMRDLPLFEELKAINANKRIAFETVPTRLTTRVIDLVTPVGRGQRGLIVAPPRAGKTTLLQHVAEAVTQNHPQLHLMILLVDERPEEVTEFKRILPRAEIFASSNDMDIKSHTRICQFAIERAKRLCECGEHVFILMDSITRMARAFNNTKSGGATMSGGVGVGALEIPRRLFAAARNTRSAGSITILATALIETGSRMDDLIFQEFKGTGNMELVLDRRIAEQYTFPAVNVLKSGTRREELLIPAFQLEKIHMLRRGLAGHKPIEAIQRVISLLERYPNNNQMLVELPSKNL